MQSTGSTTTTNPIIGTGPGPAKENFSASSFPFVSSLVAKYDDWCARRKASGRARQRRKELRLSSDHFSLYQENPFQVLGLQPDETSTREVVRRRDDINTLLGLEMSVEDNLNDFWRVGWEEHSLNAQNSSEAVARLQNELVRFEDQILWFHLDNEEPDVKEALQNGNFDKVREIWSKHCKTQDVSASSIQALHNLAILDHSQLIEGESNNALSGKVSDRKNWTNVLKSWKEVIDSGECQHYFEARLTSATDPRVNAEFIDNLIKSLPFRILKININLARTAANQGFYKYAKTHLKLVMESGFPEDAIAEATNLFFTQDMEPAKLALRVITNQSGAIHFNDEFKKSKKQYLDARKVFQKMEETKRLGDLAQKAIKSGIYRMQEIDNELSNNVYRLDLEFFNSNQRIIEVWNIEMRRHNQSFGYGSTSDLNEIYRTLQARGGEMKPIETAIATLEHSVSDFQQVCGFLSVIAKDASKDTQKELSEFIKILNSSVNLAEKALEMSREHFHRNLSSMSNNL